MTYAKFILSFLSNLSISTKLPKGINYMNPYLNEEVFELCKQFYEKYYSSNRQRTIILGINPGRYGAGLTGIPFTDPVKLDEDCGIANNLKKQRELSADFIYKMIYAYGGVLEFYDQFYFGSVSPLGFTRDGKNLNYYDDTSLQQSLLPFILQSLEAQLAFGLNRKVAYCLGEGKNYKFLSNLNMEHSFFDHIIPLAHPRFIMQYRRKTVDRYVNDYLQKFQSPELFQPS